MKTITYIALIILFTFKGLVSFAQLSKTNPQYKRANNWCFGTGVGLDFKTNPPTFYLSNTYISVEATTSISDTSGKLQFYSDGFNVFNSQHALVENGGKLLGGPSSTQCVLGVNHPENDSTFYFFTTPSAYDEEEGLKINILDGNWQSGKGKIITKNYKILPKSTEKLTAVNHQNGRDIWIIAHGFTTNAYSSFLLTKSGLIKCPIFSKVGNLLDVPVGIQSFNSQGYLRANNNGTLLASALFVSKRIELFDFDNLNGTLSPHEKLASVPTTYEPYGLAFSDNNENLFIQSISDDSSYLGYYNFSYKTYSSLFKKEPREIQAIQNTPHGNIYYVHRGQDSLGLISNPNTNPEYSLLPVDLSPRYSRHGLPNFNQSFLNKPSIEFAYTMNCYENSIAFEGRDSFYATDYKWYIRNNNTLKTDTINKENHSYYFKDTGDYLVTYIASKIGRSDTIAKPISIYPNFKKEFLGKDTFYCKGDVFTQTLKANIEGLHCWEWMESIPGIIGESKVDSLVIDSAGIYTVALVNKAFCVLRDTLIVTEHQPIPISLESHYDSLYTKQAFSSYEWFKNGNSMLGATERKLELIDTGTYRLKGIDTFGCESLSPPYLVQSLGVNALETENIVIYPNPMDKMLYFEFAKSGNFNISIFNQLGQSLWKENTNKNTFEIEVSSLPKGMYLVQIINENKILKTVKIIKQ